MAESRPEGRPPSEPDWREANHRVRNGLHTFSMLVRLSRGSVSDEELLDGLVEWLRVAPIVLDAVPLRDRSKRVSVALLVRALHARETFACSVQLEALEDPAISADVAMVVLLCIHGLLTFSCRQAVPQSTVKVSVRSGAGVARVETRFQPRPGMPSLNEDRDLRDAGWPPLGLARAAEALGGEFIFETRARRALAALSLPL